MRSWLSTLELPFVRCLLPPTISNICLISFVLFAASPTCADTFYVSMQGNDRSNDGLSAARAFRTIQRATSEVSAGDEVLVRAGRYKAFFLSDVHGDDGGDWITFRPYPGERVIVDRHLGGGNGYRAIEFYGGSYIIIDGFEVTDSDPLNAQYRDCNLQTDLSRCLAVFIEHFRGRNGIKINPSRTSGAPHHIILRDLEIHHNAGQAILGGGNHIEVLNNHIHHNGVIGEGYGMYLSGTDLRIAGNVSHDNNGHGIRAANGSHPLFRSIVENNRIYSNRGNFIHVALIDGQNVPRVETHGAGITIWSGDDNIFRNNLVYNNEGPGIRIKRDEPSYPGNNKVLNNTIVSNALAGIVDANQSDQVTFVHNNIVYANGSAMSLSPHSVFSHNLLDTDPEFIDDDFHLGENSKAAIDTGLALPEVTRDFHGVARPRGGGFDIGAYEFTGATGSAPEAPGGLRIEWFQVTKDGK